MLASASTRTRINGQFFCRKALQAKISQVRVALSRARKKIKAQLIKAHNHGIDSEGMVHIKGKES